MEHRRLFPIIAVLLACWPMHGLSLDPDRDVSLYLHDYWNTEKGLPHDTVMDIAQTRNGYLWLATFRGLVRFDGVQFTLFNKDNRPGFPQGGPFRLLVDESDNLWMATNSGWLVRFSEDGMIPIPNCDKTVGGYINALFSDRDKRMWIAARKGLFLVKKNVAGGLDLECIFDEQEVHDITQQQNGSILFITMEKLWRLEEGTIHLVEEAANITGNRLSKVYATPKGDELWVGAYGGLARKRADGWQRFSSEDGLNDLEIRALYQDHDGNLWVGTEHDGIARFNGRKFEVFSQDLGLTDVSIQRMFEDREGSFWIGTYRGGLNRLRNGKFLFFGEKQGLSSGKVRTVFCDSDGRIWLGTMGGLDCFSQGYQRKRHLKEVKDRVLSMVESPDGTLYMGTYNGLMALNGEQLRSWTTDDGLSSNLIRSLCWRKNGELWIGTKGQGINIWDGRRFHRWDEEQAAQLQYIYMLHEDRQGNLWIGTSGNGLFGWNGTDLKNFGERDGVLSNFIWSAGEEADGTIWFGSTGGLIRYQHGILTTFGTADGLPDNSIFIVIPDDHGQLWMSSNFGFFSISKRDLNLYEMGELNRIPINQLAEPGGAFGNGNGPAFPAGCKDSEGMLWFAATKGVIGINPKAIRHNPNPPEVILEQVLIDDVSYKPVDNMELAAGPINFEFQFSATSLEEPQKIRFKYKLEGLDDKWHEVTRRRAYYNRIPPKDYVFRVLACNNDGVWNEQGIAFPFKLKPHFYQTRTFFVSVVLLVLLLGAGSVLFRMNRLQIRERLLAKLVDERTSQLTQANRELARLAKYDPLTNLANRRYFSEFFEREWKRCRRNGTPLSVLMIDVDDFKIYNDHYGHAKGDACLRSISAAIKAEVHRPGDLAARYGGEEFIVILSETNAQQATMVADHILQAVRNLQIPHEHSRSQSMVTVSIGVTSKVPYPTVDPESLLKMADQALYSAKEGGRNRVERFGEPEGAPLAMRD